MASIGRPTGRFQDVELEKNILLALNEQRNSSRFCDVVLRVSGEQIYAHSNVLAAASPYFGSFLGQGEDIPRAFSQKNPQIIEILIDGSGDEHTYGEAVGRVVDFMYTSTIELTAQILTQVLEIAKIMQMKKIINFCERFDDGEMGNYNVPVTKNDIATMTDYIHNFKYQSSKWQKGSLDAEFSDKPKPVRKRGRPRKKPAESESEDDTFGSINPAQDECKEKINSEDADSNSLTEIKPDLDEKDNVVQDLNITSDQNQEHTGLRRTRGRKPITSLMLPMRSSRVKRLHSCYGKDFVIQPIRRGRRSGLKSVEIKTEKQVPENKGEEDKDDTDTDCETRQKEGLEYTCAKCSFETLDLLEMRIHRESEHGQRPKTYSCNCCSFVTKRKKQYKEHMAFHLHSKLICSFCDFKADTEDTFHLHLDKHTGPTPYFCRLCEAKFKSTTQLNVHMQKHREDKPYVCELCSASFRWKHALKNHMITHKATKDHLCDICGFATAHKSQLKAHHLIHTGETFKCDELGCKFQATKKQNLKYHMLTHTHEKPHQCEVCGQSFSLVKNMKRHMLLHMETRPYNCGVCTFSSTRYDKLKEHLLKQHGIGEVPGRKRKITDYSNLKEQANGEELPIMEIVSEETLRTAATIANINIVDAQQGDTQFVTSDGIPIITQVQYAEVSDESGLISYVNVASVE
ncbi:zinc finger protein 235-like [Gigantopelta aegis]|uniref:zinc finger protein 235-like n=1 Tax=Gigantopelta aegis TaxID=1735272 RepID=UPI001B889734|nr:zinc finger protein 235-like [Gigantopelta aegis]